MMRKFNLYFINEKKLYFSGYGMIALFVLVRIFRLTMPAEAVFDEVYYPEYARSMLSGIYAFDVHPPIGKIIIAFGEWCMGRITGNIYLGWRVMPVIFGIAMIPLAYWTAFQIFRNKRTSFIAAFLIAIDGLFVVYSRHGLLEIFLVFFGIASIGFCWKFRIAYKKGRAYKGALMLSALFAGLAMSIKWSGAAFLLIAGLAALHAIFEKGFFNVSWKAMFYVFISFVVVPAVVYILPFLSLFPWQGFRSAVIDWHEKALNFSLQLNATHPYASKWWTWPLMVYPVWFYYKVIGNNAIGINAVGNLLTWLGATFSLIFVMYQLIYKKWRLFQMNSTGLRASATKLLHFDSQILCFLIGGWAICFFPWSLIGRVLFLYHYLPAHVYALFTLSYLLSKAFETEKYKSYVLLFLIGSFIISLYFVPVWIGYPMPANWLKWWIWFETWT